MKNFDLEIAEYYEPRIRAAALETGCRTLLEDADRLSRFIGSVLESQTDPLPEN